MVYLLSLNVYNIKTTQTNLSFFPPPLLFSLSLSLLLKASYLECCLRPEILAMHGLFQVLLVVGGQAPKAIRSVECYDFTEDKWHQLAEMPSRRCRCGMSKNWHILYLSNSTVSAFVLDMYIL